MTSTLVAPASLATARVARQGRGARVQRRRREGRAVPYPHGHGAAGPPGRAVRGGHEELRRGREIKPVYTHAAQLVPVSMTLIFSECSSPVFTTCENVALLPAVSMSVCSGCSSSCTRTRSNATSAF
ncbi:hypothetical protein PR003_g28155 [Phytophthora rubi]|uniref:Uncharacterized protein n=1 Tax=Phytophthora rubi TaxID=129364 RepID=A0A6A4BWI8_9STRA|nr:hypothetical protein PR003_g28155 [Phytophthora rubi]